jgi:hypothetical protein
MNSLPYYMVRPGYGSKELLIEFGGPEEVSTIIQHVIQLLNNNGFTMIGVQDNFGSDEYCYQLTSSHGNITISIDTWDFVFIHGDNNQEDIHRIDEILKTSSQFIKKEVDFEKYKKAKTAKDSTQSADE